MLCCPGLCILAWEVGYQRPCEYGIIFDSWRVVNMKIWDFQLRGKTFSSKIRRGLGCDMAMECTAYGKGQLGNCRRFQESQYLPTVADLDQPPQQASTSLLRNSHYYRWPERSHPWLICFVFKCLNYLRYYMPTNWKFHINYGQTILTIRKPTPLL